jgi:hypothetical protein
MKEINESKKSREEKQIAARTRAQGISQSAAENKQMQRARMAADVATKNEKYARKQSANERAAKADQRQNQEASTQTYWRDDDGNFRVGGAKYAVAAAKNVNLTKHQLFSKSQQLDDTEKKILQAAQAAAASKVQEEAPANAMGTAGISGADTAVDVGIAGRDMLLSPGILRRPPPKMFGGKRVFTVPSGDYYKATLGRKKGQHWRSMVNGPLGEEIRQYALENKEAPIIVEDEITGAMMYLRYGK